jgi:hypothetical protein
MTPHFHGLAQALTKNRGVIYKYLYNVWSDFMFYIFQVKMFSVKFGDGKLQNKSNGIILHSHVLCSF